MQYESGDMSNMLADAPQTESFQQLVKLASSRKKWKQTWENDKAATTQAVQINWNEEAETAHVRILPKPKQPKPKPKQTASEKKAAAYRQRDEHEAFFRPKTARPTRGKSKRKASKKGLSKPRAKTNKERAAWARDHYAKHHGTTATTTPPSTPTAAKVEQWAAPADIPSDVLSPTPTKPEQQYNQNSNSNNKAQIQDPTTTLIHITTSPLIHSFPQSMLKLNSLDENPLTPIPILSTKPLFLITQLANPLTPKTTTYSLPHD